MEGAADFKRGARKAVLFLVVSGRAATRPSSFFHSAAGNIAKTIIVMGSWTNADSNSGRGAGSVLFWATAARRMKLFRTTQQPA